jgi:hypothetical protein
LTAWLTNLSRSPLKQHSSGRLVDNLIDEALSGSFKKIRDDNLLTP